MGLCFSQLTHHSHLFHPEPVCMPENGNFNHLFYCNTLLRPYLCLWPIAYLFLTQLSGWRPCFPPTTERNNKTLEVWAWRQIRVGSQRILERSISFSVRICIQYLTFSRRDGKCCDWSPNKIISGITFLYLEGTGVSQSEHRSTHRSTPPTPPKEKLFGSARTTQVPKMYDKKAMLDVCVSER